MGWGCLPASIHCHYVCRCHWVNVGWDITLKLCTVFTAIILCLFKYWRAFQELVHFRYWDGDGWMINWCIRRTEEERGVDFKWELAHIESWDKKDHVWIFHQCHRLLSSPTNLPSRALCRKFSQTFKLCSSSARQKIWQQQNCLITFENWISGLPLTKVWRFFSMLGSKNTYLISIN